jgi:SAM-dependent methyltransferase
MGYSETSRHRERVLPYCQGCGVDLGSGGDPICPEALSIDLPREDAERYTATDFGLGAIQWRGNAKRLHWFADGVLDYVYSSHLLEDFPDWREVLLEWGRVLKPGGYLVVSVPEVAAWAASVQAGQPMNHNHANEFAQGEIAAYLRGLGWEIVEDGWANPPGTVTISGMPDYSLLTVARKR